MKHTFKGWILDKEQIISLQDLRKNHLEGFFVVQDYWVKMWIQR